MDPIYQRGATRGRVEHRCNARKIGSFCKVASFLWAGRIRKMNTANSSSPAQFTMSATLLPLEEIARQGDEIYARVISSLEPEHNGRIVAIDVVSGRHTLADRAIEASRELQRTAGAAPENIWLAKVGSRTFCRLGSGTAESLQ